MDIFSFLPIIIFIYAIFTIFGSDNKKPQNRRPDRGRPSGSPYNRPTNFPQRETKSPRPNWRDMFEELERELFPKEVRTDQPSRTSAPSRTTPSGIGREGRAASEEFLSPEGTWGVEGTSGVEGRGGLEGRVEGSYGGEGTFNTERKKKTAGIPKAELPVPKSTQIENPVLNISPNPLVQGVIWAEVLGKPRAHSRLAYKRRS